MISKIYHIADIHIRNYKRHAEYRRVFNRLLKYIESTRDDDSVILLAGDIVHSKIDMSPELVDLTSNFLKSCADLCPTILITGNHDCNLNNTLRLDALSPIVNSLNHEQLFYWKKSGIYRLNGVSFSVFSILNEQSEWIPSSKINAKYKIALYHGPVHSAKTATGYEVSNRSVTVDLFDGFDLSLLGDIHSYQFLNTEKTIAYPGSLIQQSYGESVLGHGILIWDVKNKTSEFVEIENDIAYYTLVIESGQYFIPKNLPKKIRLRVKYFNTTPTEVQTAITAFANQYSILEIQKRKIVSANQTNNKKTNIGNSRNIDYQNALIKEFLSNVDCDVTDQVILKNIEFNRCLKQNNSNRNIYWKPLRLEFSNMFSYGKDNVLDFTNFSNNIYGICAPNAAGKSALLDVLSFTLYDKASRSSKGSHILNNKNESFHCKFSFEFENNIYFIERIGKKMDSGNVRVNVDFWYEDMLGSRVKLTGIDRDDTNRIIREIVGNYDDFIITVLSTQYDNRSFVDKTQRERKELLYRFLDISIYDELYKIAKEESRDIQVRIRDLEKENLNEKSSELQNKNSFLSDKEISLSSKIKFLKDGIKENNNNISNLNLEIQYIPDSKFSISELIIREQNLKDDIDRYENELSTIESEIKTIRNYIFTEDENNLLNSKIEEEIIRLNSIKNINEINLSHKQHKLSSLNRDREILNKHEYDPNCEFCVKNPIVQNSQFSILDIPNLENEINQLDDELKILQISIIDLNTQLIRKKYLFDLSQKNLKNDILIENLIKKKKQIFDVINNSVSSLAELSNLKEKYYEYENIITRNEEILNEINNLRRDVLLQEKELSQVELEYKRIYSNLQIVLKDLKQITINISKLSQLITDNNIYDLYLKSVSKDGIPYMILEKIIPIIEESVNDILEKVSNFTIKMETTDDKYINAFIVRGEDYWPIELTSGMERFLISIAFRVALTEISSLPRPEFLAIDEGFGVLDDDNLIAIGSLLEFLRTKYNYLIIISHVDSIRDLITEPINIEKVAQYSMVNYE